VGRKTNNGRGEKEGMKAKGGRNMREENAQEREGARSEKGKGGVKWRRLGALGVQARKKGERGREGSGNGGVGGWKGM